MIWEVKPIRFTLEGENGLPGEPMHLIVGPRADAVGRVAPNREVGRSAPDIALNRARSHH